MRVPLLLEQDHLVVRIDGGLWVLDTGSPFSFGRADEVQLGGERFPVPDEAFGLDADRLSGLVGTRLEGLIGTDLLNGFDLDFDLAGGALTIGTGLPVPDGDRIPLTDLMGVPALEARSELGAHRMLLDTGAQLSYLQADEADRFPAAGPVRDFLPMFGTFETETRSVPFRVGTTDVTLRCGRLPDLMGMTLSLAGVDGIIGAELFRGRRVGYFSSRRLFTLS